MLQRLSFNTLKQRKVNVAEKQGKGLNEGSRLGGNILPQILASVSKQTACSVLFRKAFHSRLGHAHTHACVTN